MLRSRLTYATNRDYGLNFKLEVDNVSAVGNDGHFDTRNGLRTHSVVPDPEGTDLNQLWLSYEGPAETSFKLGRQRINFDNQRFVGGVGWRQNEQTYDAFTASNASFRDTIATYSYVDRVNRIFGPDDGTPAAELNSNSHFLNVKHTGLALGDLSVYGLFLDFDNAAGLSNRTLGARFTGSRKVNDRLNLLYTAEFATQDDYGNNPADYRADYWLLEGGIGTAGVSLRLGTEVLDGDSETGVPFQTPLATLHAFQGWSDRFLTTPTGGLEDRYMKLTVPLWGASLMTAYHKLSSRADGRSFGDELDFSLSRRINDKIGMLLKYAAYSADSHSVGTEKFWLQLVYNLD